MIKSFTYGAWTSLTPVEMQQELTRKNVIVTGWPLKEKISFTESGLRKVAGTPSSQISINGKYHQFLLPLFYQITQILIFRLFY